ncbi:unnamed protein product [Dibothriocephalus latus]|uniref:Pre-mRNA 3'-end-processing endonuclease polyadenylation factor C-term domain-containing protein n=1 Tax=Dibothriocephalus latus TaxID=60516 RepID=A0A3P6PVH9_DIBLA|nr:unnamed protein product [Dibothriocephalus latus]
MTTSTYYSINIIPKNETMAWRISRCQVVMPQLESPQYCESPGILTHMALETVFIEQTGPKSILNVPIIVFWSRELWEANPMNDMYADAVQNVVLRASMLAPNSRAALPTLREPDFIQFCDALTIMFHDAFGANCIESSVIKASDEHTVLLVDDFHIKVSLKDLLFG